MNIVPSNAKQTLNSLEIAELTGKYHKSVMRDIEKMCAGLKIESAQFCADYIDGRGRKQPCYELPPREALLLGTGYDVIRRAKLIDRAIWLENQIAQMSSAQTALPAPVAELGQHRRRGHDARAQRTRQARWNIRHRGESATCGSRVSGADHIWLAPHRASGWVVRQAPVDQRRQDRLQLQVARLVCIAVTAVTRAQTPFPVAESVGGIVGVNLHFLVEK